ncbi:hypothetical protein [Pedobacter sp. UYP1]|jgi:hypothetical protein|uniref:hypothetical protein n=1 Tax=Pedobacter sp. UYP1 TaxID=1756396 RepID=UPI00339B6911
MAITKSKNKWPVFIGVIVIAAIALYAFMGYNNKKQDDRITADCVAKKYYEIPMISFAGLDSSGLKGAVIEIRRNGKRIKSELGIKSILNDDQSVDLVLYSNNTKHPFVQKQDSIVITIKSEQHVISGFKSNTIKVDHGILLCHESYEMNGEPFNSDRPNFILKKAKQVLH